MNVIIGVIYHFLEDLRPVVFTSLSKSESGPGKLLLIGGLFHGYVPPLAAALTIPVFGYYKQTDDRHSGGLFSWVFVGA